MSLDRLMPSGRWSFDGDVTDAFEDMLVRSIPQHDVMRGLVADIAVRVLEAGDLVIDLGCSRGQALAPG